MDPDLPRVISLPRNDNQQNQFVLVRIESMGRKPLDLKLIGTDGESVFSVSVKHNQTGSLKDKKFSGSSEQWDQVLARVLLGAEQIEDKQGVEAVAKLEGEASMTITIQKRIEGITLKLGAITLTEQDEVVELYDWCGLAVKSRDKVLLELEALKAQLKAKEQESKKLNETLAEMVKLKNDNENELIEKFSLLLNEKKLKIRDQQRLLASANVDPARLAAVEESRTPVRSTSVGPSRAGKRKAVKAIQDQSEDDSDGGFEKMEVDAQQPPTDSADEQPQTPDQESTADEASDEDLAPPAPAPAPTRNTANNTKNEGRDTRARTTTPAPQAEHEPLPPKRELPFAKKPTPKETPPPPPEPVAAPEGSETESDDEL